MLTNYSCDVINFSGDQNRDIVMVVNLMFTVGVDLVFRSKYVQFPMICSLQYSIKHQYS